MDNLRSLSQVGFAQLIQTLNVLQFIGITEFGFRHLGGFCHQLIVFFVFAEGNCTTDGGFTINKAPGEEAHLDAAVEDEVDQAAEAFGVDDLIAGTCRCA